ncbi:GNAT family N-acetyltransferase [Ferruginibacter sp.]|nr:GNAT family N-acetyltransferase [Ferruginibacter sp.]
MIVDLQPQHLSNEFVTLHPLKAEDFEQLYKVASDPLIWEQHPNKNRYQKEVFQTFFEGAIKSQGAFIVFDTQTNEPIGSSRFCSHDAINKTLEIGYTFLARDHWGTTYNKALKTLMLNHAFTFVDAVNFYIGAVNIRSQKSIVRFGAKKIGEIEMEYYGETSKLNYIYQLDKTTWLKERQ